MRSYVVVDVFTDVPLEGNPVAVFEDGAGLSTETMQRAARELNLSETVFLLPGESGADARARIRSRARGGPPGRHSCWGRPPSRSRRGSRSSARMSSWRPSAWADRSC